MTNVHNIFKGKLLKVDARAGDKGTEFSSNFVIRKIRLVEFYKCYMNKEIFIPVMLSSMAAIFFIVQL